MTGGEDNSHLRRSVLILVYIFRGTQRGVSRGSWILLVERRTLDYKKRLVRDGYERCKLKKMFFEPAMNLRLWQTMEE